MNTKTEWLTTATIRDDGRRQLWIQIFPDATVPILSILTIKVNVPGHQNASAYMLDLDAISDEQREGVIRLISKTFNIPSEEVRYEISNGVPILADGVSVQSADPGLFFSMMDDERVGDEWDLEDDLFHHQEWEED